MSNGSSIVVAVTKNSILRRDPSLMKLLTIMQKLGVIEGHMIYDELTFSGLYDLVNGIFLD